MKTHALTACLLAVAALGSQAAPTNPDAAAGGLALNTAKRLHQLPTAPAAATDVALTGVPMRLATLPAALRPSGPAPASACAVALTGLPMTKLTRPRFPDPDVPVRNLRSC